MARFETLPSGTIRVTVSKTIDGKKTRYTKSGTDRKELELWAAKLEYELSKGVQVRQIPGMRTLGEAMDEFIESRADIIGVRTTKEYLGYRKNAFPELMSVRINKITPRMVQSAINRESAHHAPKSVYNYWGLLRQVLAAELPDVAFNPTLPRKKQREIRIPTDAELTKMLEAVRGNRLEIPLLLGATAGLRRGEIAAIDVHRDIDYEKSLVRVNKACTVDRDNNVRTEQPKTNASYRVIELPRWVTDRIREIAAEGYEPLSLAGISQAYAKLREKTGIDSRIRLHDLRHYYASMLLAENIPDKYAMKRTGHSTPIMLKAVYQHLIDSKDDEFSKQIVSAFDKINPSENPADSCVPDTQNQVGHTDRTHATQPQEQKRDKPRNKEN